MNRKHDFYPKSTPFALAKAQTKVGAQDHERYPATSGQSTVALARGHMRRDHLFISTQFIEILGGYKCKSPHPERGAQRGREKPEQQPLPFAASTPHHLSSVGGGSPPLPSVCRFACSNPTARTSPRLRPGRDPGQPIRSHLHAHLGFPVRAVLGGEGVRGGALELTARGVSSDTCCGALVSSLRARPPFLQQGFAPFRSG